MAVKDTARKTTEQVKDSATKATRKAKDAADKAASAAKDTARKATDTVRATKAARAGNVEDAKEIAAEGDVAEMAEKAIAEADALHYQVEVNKRGLSAGALTKTLNERWENGWRLAHILEQRGNTVLVFEKWGG